MTQPNIFYMIISVVATVTLTALFSAMTTYLHGMSKDIKELLMQSGEHKIEIENHKKQFNDIWQKIEKIDAHLTFSDSKLNDVQYKNR